ncbi:MAG: methylglyoxal reductase (NADPH-dependent) gre2 [Heterodermia speciosa]|uniref:Methylglyoxal reductase (NADPH-dependent) gre2 n=1 Tax=Heterodermia speciosa TaxID=116794 RepID=A0A8H3J3I2_9LECA|nr:MAG: methylglyoxal reductase (NADPH-dependent) gre2 [Heterodermia speciosa]
MSDKTGHLILLTGASGFVAAHILESLLRHGYDVRGTVRSEATADKVRKTHSHLLEGTQSRLTFAIVPDVASPGAFNDAVKDVDGVIHTASPFAVEVEDNERDLLQPAIKGTTEIIQAVHTYAPQVKRIVITSSFASILDTSLGDRPGYTYTEADWNPISYDEAKTADGPTAYCASKNFAERAAWDFVEEKNPNFTLATICPPMVYGPLQDDASIAHLNTSSADIYRLMNGTSKEPGHTGFPAFADVRDVAEAHVKAYEHPNSSRYLTTGGNFQYRDVCEIIKRVLPAYASKVPDPDATERVETFGVDNGHASRELGIGFRGLEECIGDAVRSLVALEERG